jgi:urease accessory protein
LDTFVVSSLTTTDQDWIVWQLADSAFPTGGFVHSGGVEAAFHHQQLCSRADLISFLETALFQLGRSSLPFVIAAMEAKQSLSELDQLCDACIPNHVSNRASRSQGSTLLATASKTFPHPELSALRTQWLERALPGHLAPMLGAVLAVFGLEKRRAARLFLFTQTRGWISAAVRLGIIGPLAGQAILQEFGGRVEAIINDCLALTLEDVTQTAPALDLYQGAQDRLYSRLFQS